LNKENGSTYKEAIEYKLDISTYNEEMSKVMNILNEKEDQLNKLTEDNLLISSKFNNNIDNKLDQSKFNE